MLHEFLSTNRQALIKRCRDKVAKRTALQPTDAELQHGIPLFLEQLVRTLQIEQTSNPLESRKVSGPSDPEKTPAPSEIGRSAAKHGKDLLRQGYTVDQVVHDYGDLCQAITELAVEHDVQVKTEEFRTLNRCLDNAIADAVTAFGGHRDDLVAAESTRAMGERLGTIAHELRNFLDCTVVAVDAIRSAEVGTSGAISALLDRSLIGLRNVIDCSLADARLRAGVPLQRERIGLADFIAGVQVAGHLQARAKGCELAVSPVDKRLAVDADRQMLASAVANLLQNAFKFTRPHSHVSLRAYATADRVLIEVEDRCGGLPGGAAETLFRPFEQRGTDRTGLGLGLSITQRSVEANGGRVHVSDLPSTGCIFIIDLPLASEPPAVEPATQSATPWQPMHINDR